MHFLLRKMALFFLLLVGLAALYIAAGVGLGAVPVNRNFQPAATGVEIWVASNGVHADLVVPVRHPLADWTIRLPPAHFAGADASARYLAIGWGERNFYIHTPTWGDLTFGTAVKALFVPTPAAMHVTYIHDVYPDALQRRVVITPDQYKILVSYITCSFVQNPDGSFQLIPGAGYTTMDNFYEANGAYHLFYGCNNWVNEALKKAGIRTGLWAPFDRSLLMHLPQ
jgi:uncharacterized protein (TIGR02117 family)